MKNIKADSLSYFVIILLVLSVPLIGNCRAEDDIKENEANESTQTQEQSEAQPETKVNSFPYPVDNIWTKEMLIEYTKQLKLKDHEEEVHGGNTLSKYTDKSESNLKMRLRQNPSLHFVSSFINLPVAEKAVSIVLEKNASQIVEWLNKYESNMPRQYSADIGEVIGYGVFRGEKEVISLSKARIALKKIANNQFKILSAYPIK